MGLHNRVKDFQSWEAAIEDSEKQLKKVKAERDKSLLKLQSFCEHPFIVRRPGWNCGTVDRPILRPEWNLCLVCGLEEAHCAKEWEDSGKNSRYPFSSTEDGSCEIRHTWYCYLFNQDGSFQMDWAGYIALVRSKMVMNSLKQLKEYNKKYDDKETTNDEQRMIEFVRFCNYQAEIASINANVDTPGHELLSE